MFNAFIDSEALNIVLTTGSGEITQCTKNEFETGDLSFTDISNRTAITIGQYVILLAWLYIYRYELLYLNAATATQSMLTMALLITLTWMTRI